MLKTKLGHCINALVVLSFRLSIPLIFWEIGIMYWNLHCIPLIFFFFACVSFYA